MRVEVNGTVILRLSMTICGGSYHPGFEYKDLFDLADQKIVKEKRSRTGETLERAAVADVNGDEIRIDMKILARRCGRRILFQAPTARTMRRLRVFTGL